MDPSDARIAAHTSIRSKILPDPNSADYDDYCRVKLMMQYPFTVIEDLLNVAGIECATFSEAFGHCQSLGNQHPDDFLSNRGL